MAAKLKWGIASAGKISHDFCTAVRLLFPEQHEFVAVAARSLDSAIKFASMHQIHTAYGTYEDLGSDPNIDVVYVGSINTTHHEIATMLLNAGKHVLVEKPLTLNAKQSQELVDLARAKGLFLMEAIWSRFLPSYQFARQQIQSGAIGDVVHVQVGFGVPIQDVARIAKPEMGGGTILDLGVYSINGALFLGYPGADSEPESILANGIVNEFGVDIAMNSVLTFSGRRTASLSTDGRAKHPNTLNIIGTKGVLTVESPFWCSEVVTVNGERHEFKFPPAGLLAYNYDNSAGLAYEAEEVRRCIAAGEVESDTLSHADSLRIARIQDEMRRQLGVKFPQDN